MDCAFCCGHSRCACVVGVYHVKSLHRNGESDNSTSLKCDLFLTAVSGDNGTGILYASQWLMAFGIVDSTGTPIRNSLWGVCLLVESHFNYLKYAFHFSCQSVQNLGLAVITIVTGKIVEAYGYFWLEIFFIASLTGKESKHS